MKVIGLTGGIATGKSAVSGMLKKRGFQVIDADIIVHALQEADSPILNRIVRAFGDWVLCADGSLDRRRLGQVIFENTHARDRLASIMHPAVRAELERLIAGCKSNVLFLDVPLLFEAGFDDLTSVNLVISASAKKQLQRLMKRDGLTIAQAQARIDSQMAMSEKVALADYVIENDGDLCELEEKVEKFLGAVKAIDISPL